MKTDHTKRECLYHLCKLSHNGNLIFYSTVDFLVFTTIVFSYASYFRITITGFCIMLNHFHIAVYADLKKDVTLFYQMVSSLFSRMYNKREGKVKIKWKKGINISEKHGVKCKKSLYIYIANNAPCKKCCKRVSEYKWAFLNGESASKYFASSNNHSCKQSESKQLELAKAVARDAHKANRPLDYGFFDHFTSVLSAEEQKELWDYVLTTYVSIDYTDIISLFGSFEAFLTISDMTVGADYDTEEDLAAEDYKHYRKMTLAMQRLGLEGNDSALHDEDYDISALMRYLLSVTAVSQEEMVRFLHL